MAANAVLGSEETPTEILDQRNYVPEPPESIQGLSPRVWIGDLPHTTTKRSILNAVRGANGVLQIDKACIKISLPDGSTKPVAIFSVLFGSVESARRFITFTTRYGILYQRGDGPVRFGRAADRPPAVTGAAYAYPVKILGPVDQMVPAMMNFGLGFTRVWQLDSFPETAVWFILNCIGLKNVLHATHTVSDSTLRVEFVSLQAASLAAQRIFFNGLPYLRGHPVPGDGIVDGKWFGINPVLRYLPDPCNGSLQELRDQPYYTPKLSDTEFIEKFNALPYNIDWRLTYHPCMAYAAVPVRTADQQFSMLKELDTKYFGGNIWSWEIPEGTRKAVFYLLETQSDQEWRKTWMRFYRSTNDRHWNFARLAWYGEVVLHRKEMRGMCSEDCVYGCNLGRAPIPQVVQDYYNKSIELPNDADEEGEFERVPHPFGASSVPQPEPDDYYALQPLDKFKRYCQVKDERFLAGGSDSGYSGASEGVPMVADAHATPPLTPHDDDKSVASSDAPSPALDQRTLFDRVNSNVEIVDGGDA